MPPLKEFTDETLANEYERLMQDAWLARKTNRERRLNEIINYIDQNCIAEMNPHKKGLVVDIGPGPGEFLEIARLKGNKILGVDAPSGKGGMGENYVRVSQLMHIRQKIPVMYVRFTVWLSSQTASQTAPDCKLINFRGSIEQCFSKYMDGPGHDKHQDCMQLSWKENDATIDAIEHSMEIMSQLLVRRGAVLIHANGARNHQWFWKKLHIAAHHAGFVSDFESSDGRLMKWIKP